MVVLRADFSWIFVWIGIGISHQYVGVPLAQSSRDGSPGTAHSSIWAFTASPLFVPPCRIIPLGVSIDDSVPWGPFHSLPLISYFVRSPNVSNCRQCWPVSRKPYVWRATKERVSALETPLILAWMDPFQLPICSFSLIGAHLPRWFFLGLGYGRIDLPVVPHPARSIATLRSYELNRVERSCKGWWGESYLGCWPHYEYQWNIKVSGSNSPYSDPDSEWVRSWWRGCHAVIRRPLINSLELTLSFPEVCSSLNPRFDM